MSNPQVTVTLKGTQAEFRSHGPGSDRFAEYLGKMFDQANNPTGTRKALMAKAGLGDTVLKERELQAEKAGLLLKQAAQWEDRSRDWSLSTEIRELNADRARKAREEARKISQELGG